MSSLSTSFKSSTVACCSLFSRNALSTSYPSAPFLISESIIRAKAADQSLSEVEDSKAFVWSSFRGVRADRIRKRSCFRLWLCWLQIEAEQKATPFGNGFYEPVRLSAQTTELRSVGPDRPGPL